MASHHAAREAAKLGYANVFVMADGIDGWVKGGKPVEKG
jgi:rhodanese-related sulfurtransferase